MTSLQQQLKRLTVPHVTQALEAKKVSLLFDSKDAAALDISDVLDISLSGLEELIGVNKSFAKFRKNLFNKETVGFNRATRSKEANENLDQILQEYLVEVSSYFPMRSAQKTVEWLVHRHQINNFNVDDWLMSILPHHNSKIFVRVLMILDLSNPTGRWHWLNECAKHGVPVPRKVVVNHCKSDAGFFRYLLSTVASYKSISGADSPVVRERVKFCFEISLDMIKDVGDVKQETVATIFEFLSTGVKSKCLVWESYCYSYIPRLVMAVPLAADKIVRMCRTISRKHSEELIRKVVLVLNFVVANAESEVPDEAFSAFSFSKVRLQEIVNVAEVVDILPLLRKLQSADSSGVLKDVVSQIDGVSEETKEEEEEQEQESMEVDEQEKLDVDGLTEKMVDGKAEKKKKEWKLKYKFLSEKNLYEVISMLASDVEKIRQRCLKFVVAKHSSTPEKERSPLLNRILKRQEEIGQDSMALVRIFEKTFSSEAMAKKDSVKKCHEGVVGFLLDEETSVDAQLAVLKCFGRSRLADTREAYLDLAERHVVGCAGSGKEESHVKVITAILENLSVHAESAKDYTLLILRLLDDSVKGDCLRSTAVESLLSYGHGFEAEANDDILKRLVNLSLKAKKSFGNEVFRKFTFREEFLRRELKDGRKEEEKEEAEPKLKKMRLSANQNVDVKKAVFLLEVLNVPRDRTEVTKTSNLLMNLLADLSKESRVKTSDLEYCRRLILARVHEMISRLPDLDEVQLNVEVLVQCLRCTTNLQTQKQVVTLMAAVAPHFPRELLYNVVSVFSFMGDEIFRNDDEHSFQIITSLADVVLQSVQSLGREGEGKGMAREADKTLLEVARIFVDSRHHVPRHRFGPLMERLLSADPVGLLWKVVVAMVESCVCKREAACDEAEFKKILEAEHELVSMLVSDRSADARLDLLVRLISFARKMTAEDGGKLEVVDENLMKQPRLRRLTLHHLGKTIQALLDAKIFFSRVEDSSKIKTLLQDTVRFMHDIDARRKTAPPGSTEERFWPSLVKVVQGIFDRMNDFVPSRLFVEVVESLVSTDSLHVRNKGLELLNGHLVAVERRGDATSSLGTLDLVPLLVKILEEEEKSKKKKDKNVDSKLELLSKQQCFLNLKLMMRVYGEDRWAHFDPVYRPIISCMDVKGTSCIALTDCALLCLSDLISVGKVRLLPRLDEIVTSIVRLYASEEILKSTISLNCLNKAVAKLAVELGRFITGRLDDLVSAVGLSLKVGVVPVEEYDTVFQALATKVETRILVPALERCYKRLIGVKTKSILAPFLLFREHCKSITKGSFGPNFDTISSLVGTLLKFRCDAKKLDSSDADSLDEVLVGAVRPLVYLMSESSFKTAFGSYLGQVSVRGDSIVTFYRLMEEVAGILRGLFCVFSRSLLPLLTETLRSSDGRIFSACSVRAYRMIAACHIHDREDAFALKASEGLYSVLSDAMERSAGTESEGELVDCYVETARSIKDVDVSKVLFEGIYAKLQHEDPKVKVVALKVVKFVGEAVRSVNDAFLQDVCPYIVEIVDDDDETVAKLGHEILAGPLKGMIESE